MDQQIEVVQLSQPILITATQYNHEQDSECPVAICRIIYNPDSEDDYTEIKSDVCEMRDSESNTQDSDSILCYESDYEDELEMEISER